MVTNFNDWCYDASRQTGDTGIVESPYGYHVMYFVADSETNYRDFQVANHLRSHDAEDWYNALMFTTVGKIVLAVCALVIFVTALFMGKFTKPVEYKR
jgi:hypothetical protein